LNTLSYIYTAWETTQMTIKEQLAALLEQYITLQDAVEETDNDALKEAIDRMGAHFQDAEDALDSN